MDGGEETLFWDSNETLIFMSKFSMKAFLEINYEHYSAVQSRIYVVTVRPGVSLSVLIPSAPITGWVREGDNLRLETLLLHPPKQLAHLGLHQQGVRKLESNIYFHSDKVYLYFFIFKYIYPYCKMVKLHKRVNKNCCLDFYLEIL